jgi:fibronectin-binding autotransporter adhesin
MKFTRHHLLAHALVTAVVTCLPLHAATLHWDGDDLGPDADGGPGDWDLSTTNWDDFPTAGVDVAWPTTATGDDDAVFGGVAGTVFINAAGVAVNDITFNTANYLITGDTLTLDGTLSDPTITTGVAASISSSLLGTHGLAKSGNGTLRLDGDNSGLTGTLRISGVTSGNNGGIRAAGNGALAGFSAIDIANGGGIQLEGATIGAEVEILAAGGGGLNAPRGVIRSVSGASVVDADIQMTSSIRLGNEGTSTTINGAITAPVGSGSNIYFRFASNQGLILTNPDNYWEGISQLGEGSYYFHPGALPDNTNLWIGQVGSCHFETNGTYTSTIGNGLGQTQIGSNSAASNTTTTPMGFSARGGDLTVDLGTVTWGSTTLGGTNFFACGAFSLAGPNATHTCTLASGLDLNGANRTVTVSNGAAEIDGQISGTISGGAGSVLTKTGAGILLLSGANTHAGGTTVAQSQGSVNALRISHPDALGTGSLTIGAGGNNDMARIELAGDITVTNGIPSLTSRNNDVPHIVNASGDNTITSNINSGGGGSRVTIRSDAGKLTLQGNIGTRQLNLFGDGDGEILGNVPLQGTNGLVKNGAGTWTLAGTSTYVGTTVISAGTLQVGAGGASGSLGSGDVTNNSTLVFDRDGTLAVTGSITGGGTIVKRGPGLVSLNGVTASWTGTTTVEAGRLDLNGDGSGLTGALTIGDGDTPNGSATLGGDGTVGGAISLAADGVLSPGSGVGTLTATQAVGGNGTLAIEVDGATGDTLNASGTLDISGLSLEVTELSTPTAAVYLIVDGSSPLTGAAFASVGSLPAGYSLVYGYNDGADTHNIALVGSGLDPFDAWAQSTHTLAGPDAEATADPDDDDLDNGTEFVLGGDPKSDSSALRPTLVNGTSEIVFTFRRSDLALTQPGIDIAVEYGSTLAGWTTAQDGVNGVTITVVDDGFGAGIDRVAVSVPKSLAAGGRLFARLRAAVP